MKPLATLAIALALVTSSAVADTTLYVRVPAVLDPQAPIAAAVLAECQVEDMVAINAVSGIRGTYLGRTQMTRGATKTRELQLTMLDVTGVGPGPWTRKAIRLRADLVQGDRVLVSGVFERESGSGGPALRSACTTLGKIAVLLGKQIGRWANSAMAGLPAEPSVVRIDEPDLRAVERLETLKKLHAEGMISDGEYAQKRAEILKGL